MQQIREIIKRQKAILQILNNTTPPPTSLVAPKCRIVKFPFILVLNSIIEGASGDAIP